MTKERIDPIVTDLEELQTVCAKTSWEQVRELKLVERIKASLLTSWTPGVGLAAIQIGVPVAMAWFKIEEKEYTLINPIITKATEPIIVPKEGCLSIPDVWTNTRRYSKIEVACMNEKKGIDTMEFTGFAAIVVQHEIDHMAGILNIQRRYSPPKVAGRNDPCPCGSGKKYKKCCLGKAIQPEVKNELDNCTGDSGSMCPTVADGRPRDEMGKGVCPTGPAGPGKVLPGRVLDGTA